MNEFITNMWVLKKFTQVQIQTCVTKGYITQDQANMILATPQA
ncbi:conserved hypothetical protein [Candidatus Desulfosporosinus infrequens]|uniref:XkdX family protein n=1 Tax=Candidatus Desulfosporosinus infrequens TaxID=2043169 RepID=A0A2U3L667_9FIRM|nr:conserved hypothetical protein [Candidatus Desulfosporosinus infrequens]